MLGVLEASVLPLFISFWNCSSGYWREMLTGCVSSVELQQTEKSCLKNLENRRILLHHYYRRIWEPRMCLLMGSLIELW